MLVQQNFIVLAYFHVNANTTNSLIRNIHTLSQAGLTAADEEIADWLRRNYSDKYIILAVNKCESPRKGMMQASEFWSLGYVFYWRFLF